jgi:hypothetical protein
MRRRRRVAFSSLLVFGICLPITSEANSTARSAPCLAVERTRGRLGDVDFARPISTRRRMACERGCTDSTQKRILHQCLTQLC